jgi:hypothetical protein
MGGTLAENLLQGPEKCVKKIDEFTISLRTASSTNVLKTTGSLPVSRETLLI